MTPDEKLIAPLKAELASARAENERLQRKYAHFQVQATRWQHRCEDIEAAARGLLDAMTRFGPDDSGQLWDAAQALRSLLGDETTPRPEAGMYRSDGSLRGY